MARFASYSITIKKNGSHKQKGKTSQGAPGQLLLGEDRTAPQRTGSMRLEVVTLW